MPFVERNPEGKIVGVFSGQQYIKIKDSKGKITKASRDLKFVSEESQEIVDFRKRNEGLEDLPTNGEILRALLRYLKPGEGTELREIKDKILGKAD